MYSKRGQPQAHIRLWKYYSHINCKSLHIYQRFAIKCMYWLLHWLVFVGGSLGNSVQQEEHQCRRLQDGYQALCGAGSGHRPITQDEHMYKTGKYGGPDRSNTPAHIKMLQHTKHEGSWIKQISPKKQGKLFLKETLMWVKHWGSGRNQNMWRIVFVVRLTFQGHRRKSLRKMYPLL